MAKDKIFDDLARMAGGSITLLSGLGEQLKNDIDARIKNFADKMDFVPREDFERLEDVVDTLNKRIDNLENKNQQPKQRKDLKK